MKPFRRQVVNTESELRRREPVEDFPAGGACRTAPTPALSVGAVPPNDIEEVDMRTRWFSWRRRNTAPSRPHDTNAPYRAGGAHRANRAPRNNAPYRASRPQRANEPHRANAAQRPAAPNRPAAPEPPRSANRPVNLPAWMTQPTLAEPQPGRVGWLTPAQEWRANGGRW